MQKIVMKMPFWTTLMLPLTEDDALDFCRCLKYKYFEKGEAIRRAMTETDKLYFILEGKVVCSFPN